MTMREKYIPKEVETKQQQNWAENRAFEVEVDPTRPKFYMLEMLPYPSGKIHIGHVRNYSIGDAYAWYKRLNGFNVLHPIGWDAFGMPAENAAIKHGMAPNTWTRSNIDVMRGQLRRVGFGYDWSREIASCLPEYYRWNQWFFIQMFKRGLVYRKRATVNWCAKCQTSLANEQAEGGFCWRHEDTPVERRDLEQWFVRLTKYNEELLAGIDGELKGRWPDKVLTMQRNWIGRSEGAFLDFALAGDPETKIRVFTTRLDTIFGANAVVTAPEHPLIETLLSRSPNRAAVETFIAKVGQMSAADRTGENTEKEGIDTGVKAVNPFTGEEIPVWIANFVLAEYGTGALMCVPAHDTRDYEFSRKYHLPIHRVIWPDSDVPDENDTLRFAEMPFTEHGILGPMCGEYTGMTGAEAIRAMAAFAESRGIGHATVTYRIRDWGISRQRAWGTPIPMIHCPTCGIVPADEADLPVRLPDDLDFSVGSPLTHSKAYLETTCPSCGGAAKRDTDTMDTFVDSNWYYFRYCDPKNDRLPFDPEVVKYWMPVDFYIGGVEHAVLHLIYTRTWSMIMRDLGLIEFGEPVKALLTQGMVILNGAKMSKNKGNVVDPDEMIDRYGSDATRLSILFAAPPEKEVDWKKMFRILNPDHPRVDQIFKALRNFSEDGTALVEIELPDGTTETVKEEDGMIDYPAAEGGMRYLSRVWRLVRKWHVRLVVRESSSETFEFSEAQGTVRRVTHQTIKRITEAFEDGLRLNVAVAACMELTNALYDFDATVAEVETASIADCFVMGEALDALVTMLATLAPHIAEECWEALGHHESLARSRWPRFDAELARDARLEIPVQINGKVRTKLSVDPQASNDELEKTALEDAKVQAHIAGKSVVKVIVVPKRLVNIVVKG